MVVQQQQKKTLPVCCPLITDINIVTSDILTSCHLSSPQNLLHWNLFILSKTTGDCIGRNTICSKAESSKPKVKLDEWVYKASMFDFDQKDKDFSLPQT